MKAKSSPQKPSAFSLPELLVVIAIILILAALAIPAFNKMTAGAQAVKCVTFLKVWGQAMNAFAQEDNSNQKLAVMNSSDSWASSADEAPYWKYLHDNETRNDPGIKLFRNGIEYYRVCPAGGTYAMNANLQNQSILNIPRPSRTVVLVDADSLALWNTDADWNGNINPRHGNKANVLFLDWHIESLKKGDILPLRTEYESAWGPYTR